MQIVVNRLAYGTGSILMEINKQVRLVIGDVGWHYFDVSVPGTSWWFLGRCCSFLVASGWLLLLVRMD